jgi:predicted SprT family Zn-dependent metalloprotease
LLDRKYIAKIKEMEKQDAPLYAPRSNHVPLIWDHIVGNYNQNKEFPGFLQWWENYFSSHLSNQNAKGTKWFRANVPKMKDLIERTFALQSFSPQQPQRIKRSDSNTTIPLLEMSSPAEPDAAATSPVHNALTMASLEQELIKERETNRIVREAAKLTQAALETRIKQLEAERTSKEYLDNKSVKRALVAKEKKDFESRLTRVETRHIPTLGYGANEKHIADKTQKRVAEIFDHLTILNGQTNLAIAQTSDENLKRLMKEVMIINPTLQHQTSPKRASATSSKRKQVPLDLREEDEELTGNDDFGDVVDLDEPTSSHNNTNKSKSGGNAQAKTLKTLYTEDEKENFDMLLKNLMRPYDKHMQDKEAPIARKLTKIKSQTFYAVLAGTFDYKNLANAIKALNFRGCDVFYQGQKQAWSTLEEANARNALKVRNAGMVTSPINYSK